MPAGNPSRTNRYVFPRSMMTPFWIALAAGMFIAGVLSFVALTKAHPLASPGPLATAHANFEGSCASCHAPRVADVRCEHCHDPVGTGRYQNAGHVWSGTKNPAVIQKAAILDCIPCHSDHHGRLFNLSAADDRQCRDCHFRSLAKHPEFAPVKAGISRDEGMQLS